MNLVSIFKKSSKPQIQEHQASVHMCTCHTHSKADHIQTAEKQRKEMLKADRAGKRITFRGTNVRPATDFSPETM